MLCRGQVLLRHGGKFDVRDREGKTPQMLAAERCDGDVVRYLLLVQRAAKFSGGYTPDHQVPQRRGSALQRAPSAIACSALCSCACACTGEEQPSALLRHPNGTAAALRASARTAAPTAGASRRTINARLIAEILSVNGSRRRGKTARR